MAIGSPFGLEGTVTTGIVSALNRTIQAPNNFTINGAIQTDAAINHGNSGGPLLDADGHVIGINAQIESDSGGNDGVGFAIPSSIVQRVAQQLISSGKVAHAYLGVQLSDGNGGAQVGQVVSGAPAADAGVRTGDVVTAIDGKSITGADALVTAVDGKKPGDTVTLKVRRGGSTSDDQGQARHAPQLRPPDPSGQIGALVSLGHGGAAVLQKPLGIPFAFLHLAVMF